MSPFMGHIRPFRAGDEQGIQRLFEDVFGQPMTSSHWEWKYRPSIEEAVLPIVVVNDAGAIVGHAGAFLLRGVYHGVEKPLFQVCDVMVERSLRGYLGSENLYTRMMRELFDQLASLHPEAFGYGFPGTRPYKLGAYAGFYQLIEHACESEVTEGVHNRWTKIARVPLVDRSLDPLWHRLQDQFALGLIRDARYVQWRYADHPSIRYFRVALCRYGRAVGWAVLNVTADKTRIVDVLCRFDQLGRWTGLLARWLRREGLPPAVIWLPAWLHRQVPGPWQMTEVHTANMVFGHFVKTDAVESELFYTMGDLDIF